MGAGFQQVTDLYDIYHVVQNTMIRYPIDTIIASLKEFFAKDAKYHYVQDEWGYAKTIDHTGTLSTDGLYNNIVTRIFIGEYYRNEVQYFPCILVKSGSFKSVPISMNRDIFQVEYERIEFISDTGTRKFITTPKNYVMDGAWEGNISIEVQAEDIRTRDDITELISIYFQDLNWNNFYRAGISIKPEISVSGPSESDNRNSKIFKRTVDINIRGEWRKEVPIIDIIKSISFCVEFGAITPNMNYEIVAPNLEINSEYTLEKFIIGEDVVLGY
jgi:hypothetical protein